MNALPRFIETDEPAPPVQFGWTNLEIAQVRRMADLGMTTREIAQATGRTAWAVRAKLDGVRTANMFAGAKNERKRNKLASQWHLIDLKRAGHSPTRTELSIPSEGFARNPAPTSERSSSIGSCAAMCAGA